MTWTWDLVQAISDPYREAVDFGLAVEFPPEEMPAAKRPLLIEPNDLARPRPPDPAGGGRMTDRLEAIRVFRAHVGGRVPIMGWVEADVAYHPAMVAAAVSLAVKGVQGQPLDGFYQKKIPSRIILAELITQENAKDYYEPESIY